VQLQEKYQPSGASRALVTKSQLDIVHHSDKCTGVAPLDTDGATTVRAGTMGFQEPKQDVMPLPEASLMLLLGTGLVGIAMFLGRKEKRGVL